MSLSKTLRYRLYKYLIGTIEGQWVKGIIDFVNFGNGKGVNEVGELKTRQSFSTPSEAQQSKDNFQISFYKVIFDFLVNQEVPFPVDYFFAHFSLKRTQLLPQNIIDELEGLGHVAVTIEDLVLIYKAMFRPMDKVSFNLIMKYKLQVPTPNKPIFIGIRYPIFDLEGTLRQYNSGHGDVEL
ncbi:unnamed protein product [Arabis nemorensis]|uniref:Uncharacterized protein n=1 Tax=Arabis nemorensis TaxID=586526 RepID=A0A565AW58_9BRAS|nr:unnamed protein product [Arabis nemorensis]